MNTFGKKKWIQTVTKKIQSAGTGGSFRHWCKSKGLVNKHGKVTLKCINRALKSDSLKVRRRAQFAKNTHGYTTFGSSSETRYLTSLIYR